MIENNVSLDLMEYVETTILPRYTQFDKAHNLSHVSKVIKASLELARQMGENGRRAVREKYNWATQENILFELYRNL